LRVKRTGGESPPPITERMSAQSLGRKGSAFLDTLHEQEQSHAALNLEKLLANVDDTAKKLLSDRSKANLKAYREAVRSFMKEAVGGSYRMKGERRWDRRGNARVLYLIERVNKNLEEVATMVLQKQEDAMAVMAKMDEIRGLLVDLYY
jgi:uncharacterized protein YaaR (DUF327 family)